MKSLVRLSLLGVFSLLLASCNDMMQVQERGSNDEAQTKMLTHIDAYTMELPADVTEAKGADRFVLAATLTESFETGTKTSYAAADVTLGSGVWNFDNALLGTSTSDRKNGTKSARITGTGRITMQFNRTTGAGTVSVRHALFGTDASSTWELWASTNSGSTWVKVGNTVTTSSTTLNTVNFTTNISGTVRFQIRKTSGSATRINFDDFSITDYTPYTPVNVHVTFGNASSAVTSTSFPANYLHVKSQFTMSYHRDKGIPNWVAWHLASNWLGSTPRQDDFRADNTLPSGWYQVGSSSYSGSGFDRGHMCPSADRTLTVTDNSATFLMTNMIPQSPDNNQGPWAVLENYGRTLVSQGNEVYIYAGGYGSGGTGSNGLFYTIDQGRIAVPARVWKIMLVLPNGTNDVSRVTTSTRIIAVDMPNTQGIRNNSWGIYRVSVDQIESATGLNLLDILEDSLENTLESRVDNGATS
jgi:endonuclease G